MTNAATKSAKTTIRDNEGAIAYLAEIGHAYTLTETARGPVVVEKHFCARCGGAGVLECYRGVNGGVCFKCNGFNSRETVHTPIVDYARRVKREEARAAKRLRDMPKKIAALEAKEAARQEALLAGQRRWCEAQGHGSITFAELDAKRAAERAAKIAASGHVGAVGEKLTIEVTHTRAVFWDTAYGMQGIYFFQDAAGNILAWRTTNGLFDETGMQIGQTERETKTIKLTIKATVKEHGEYKGAKQTSILRVKVIASNLTAKSVAA